MTSAVKTHIGYVRDENQDRVEIREFGDNLLVAVCDGMGGERSGSKASSMASDVFFEHFEEGYEADMDAYSIRSLLLSSVSAANSVVYTTARMDYQNFGMGTTCVAAFVSDTYIAVANVGDSRAYLLRDGTLSQVTTDHTVVHMLLENGQIATQYVDLSGAPSMDVDVNPNGSVWAIEGITSPDGRVFGKMGHAERTGAGLYKNVPGEYDMKMFTSAVRYFR